MSDLMYYRDERMTKRTYEWIKALETELAELRESRDAYKDTLENIVEGKCRKSGLKFGSWQMEQKAEQVLAKYKGDKK